ncbi:aorsin precursor [Colletotrichum cuscutae]|uniref:Aorsin n=1 Tax=Colletotrichum cuscutae TaxID=1209917 RepID=A0AAI9V4N7_9PEZI|nr:aorsin precursor [Colletotrichum cuscutae]
MHFRVVFLAVFLGPAAADYLQDTHSVHEKREEKFGSGWSKVETKPNPGTIIPLQIALQQNGLDVAEHELLGVSDPSSPEFSQHWTRAKVDARFSPTRERIHTIQTWLGEVGIGEQHIRRSADGGWLFLNTTLRVAEKLLKTTFGVYLDPNSNEEHLACDEYSLPDSVRPHVDFVICRIVIIGAST